MADALPQLANRPSYIHDLKLEGFGYPVPPYGGLKFHSFSAEPCMTQFEAFATRVYLSLGRSYLPIYRMADGEFAFLVGWRAPLEFSRNASPMQKLRRVVAGLRRKVDHRVSSTMWGEGYNRHEKTLALQRMERSIQHISKRGVLALYLMERADHWGSQYLEPVSDWFHLHQITLECTNYVPFYFVYALLNGPARKKLYWGRHVLIVTHLTDPRMEAIENGLRKEGVASVQFLGISSNRSMLDQLDLTRVHRPVDLALVAAGIGSVNILQQLEPLSVPCIDSGVCLECFVNESRRFERPYLLDDERMKSGCIDTSSLRFLSSLSLPE